jgi:hypothetical protein
MNQGQSHYGAQARIGSGGKGFGRSIPLLSNNTNTHISYVQLIVWNALVLVLAAPVSLLRTALEPRVMGRRTGSLVLGRPVDFSPIDLINTGHRSDVLQGVSP